MGDDCYFFEFWKLEDKYEALKSRADALAKALDFYADGSDYDFGKDGGLRAKAALREFRDG